MIESLVVFAVLIFFVALFAISKFIRTFGTRESDTWLALLSACIVSITAAFRLGVPL